MTNFFILRALYLSWNAVVMSRSASDSTLHAKSFCRYCKHRNEILCINYSNTTKNNVLFIDVLASRRTPSSGLTSGAGRQYEKLIRKSVPIKASDVKPKHR